jgi:hypothetical protein
MRHLFLTFLLPFTLVSVAGSTLAAEHQFQSSLTENLTSNVTAEKFYTEAAKLVQRQIDLIARIEQALTNPDPHRIRVVKGQLTIQSKTVERFVNRQQNQPQTVCGSQRNFSPFSEQLNTDLDQIYCSLYTSNQELLKLSPILDIILSRRGELALIRELPLISGERKPDPILSIAPLQYPQLGQPALPFSALEPNFSSNGLGKQPQVIGRTAKTSIANYAPPVQAAIVAPESALTYINSAKEILLTTKKVFPAQFRFTDPWKNAETLDRLTYGISPQEPQIYAQFLALPNTGIFRVLQSSAYQRPLNTLANRLLPQVSERYPFPSLGDAQDGFNPSLALQMRGERFQLVDPGLDYSFMIDVGNIPLEELDSKLKAVASPTRNFFLNYQPPEQLAALKLEKRRFLTGKDQPWQQPVIFAHAPVKLNHTYLVRSLQFQVPETMFQTPAISAQQLQQIPSSDIIIAFRPVRQRSDGSYTVLWRVLQQLPAPAIKQ